MGLDTSHDCWSGSYSAFDRWRNALAKVAKIPLALMDGHYDGALPDSHEVHLPISWDSLRPDPLHVLLNHSDCAGSLLAVDCPLIADRLEELLPSLAELDKDPPGWFVKATKRFINGLRAAAAAGEDVEFY